MVIHKDVIESDNLSKRKKLMQKNSLQKTLEIDKNKLERQ